MRAIFHNLPHISKHLAPVSYAIARFHLINPIKRTTITQTARQARFCHLVKIGNGHQDRNE
jgi:hypothetical protein